MTSWSGRYDVVQPEDARVLTTHEVVRLAYPLIPE